MVPFRSDVNPRRRGGTQAKIGLLNGVKDKDWWISPPPIISFVWVLRQGGELDAATERPKEDGALCGLTETSVPQWYIEGAFLGSVTTGDTTAVTA